MADDHALVLEGVRRLLENEFDLVGTVEDGESVVAAAESLRPDVVLLDISMPSLNAIEAGRRLVKSLPGTRVIFLTMHTDPTSVKEGFRPGATGYLLKRCVESPLAQEVEVAAPVIEDDPTPGFEPQTGSSRKLTVRQREVLQLVAEGKPNKEIAARLQVSEKTIDFHKSCIKRELDVHSTAELTQFAIRHRMVPLEPLPA
jgi:DNA-binding NarL/FixJ family response regulator